MGGFALFGGGWGFKNFSNIGGGGGNVLASPGTGVYGAWASFLFTTVPESRWFILKIQFPNAAAAYFVQLGLSTDGGATIVPWMPDPAFSAPLMTGFLAQYNVDPAVAGQVDWGHYFSGPIFLPVSVPAYSIWGRAAKDSPGAGQVVGYLYLFG